VKSETDDRGSASPSGLGSTDIFMLLLMQLMWAGGFILTKIGVDDMSPLLFSALRFVIVSALLVPLLRWHQGQMRLVALIALLTGSVHIGLTNTGLAMSEDVAPVAIAAQLVVPFATLLSVIFLHERLGLWRIFALIVAFAGVLVIGFDPVVFRYGLALLLVIAGALAMATGTIFMRRVRGVPVYEMQAWLALLSWPPLLSASLVLDGSPIEPILHMSWAVAAGIAWMVFGAGLIGQATYYWVMQRHEVGRTAPFMLLAPILGAIGGAVFLGDVITWRIGVGGGLTLAGVLIITLHESRSRATGLGDISPVKRGPWRA